MLSGPEADRIRKHLGKCPACKAVMAEELAFAGRLATLPAEEPKNDVWALVRSRTKPRTFAIGWLRGFMSGPALIRKALALTAAVGILCGALYTGLRPPDQPKQVVRHSPAATVAVGWSDDPIGGHTDAVVKFIDDM